MPGDPRVPAVHTAALALAPGADPAAPGGAVTLALCGSCDHRPPCRIPHHTAASGEGAELEVRVVFLDDGTGAARATIAAALASGQQAGPDGEVSAWTLLREDAEEPTDDELQLARRLARG